MARIWKEPRTGHALSHFDLHGYQGLPGHDVSRDDKLLPVYTYCVEVCGFCFRFGSVEQIPPVIEYYSRKIHPSSRLPDSHWLRAEHDVAQRWFERLPGHLKKESKRLKVVKALEEALETFQENLGSSPRPRNSL